MSAEVLRQAAEAMRVRAEGAPPETRTSGVTTGVWLNSAYHLTTTPAVALAVADWLDYQAKTLDHNVSEGARAPGCHPTHPAFAVARAYLGNSS